MSSKKTEFINGIKAGLPIGLGYLSVSFAFGMMAVSNGIPAWAAVLISASCLTSAGQFAGLSIIAAAGGLFEVALSQLVINLRYCLMSLSLTQKLDSGFTPLSRAAVAFGNTDEIFAVAMSRNGRVSREFMCGLISTPFCGWVFGTFLGAVSGKLLPLWLRSALGIAIYAMFIAIIIPPAKKFRPVLISSLMAAALSCIFYFVPALMAVSSGFSIIICSVVSALLCALLFPIKEEAA